jgi:hypothetical protein
MEHGVISERLLGSHKVLTDAPPPEDAREFCPSCGFLMSVLDCDIYLDEEAAAWRP